MPIYLIRHGETALNAARIMQPANTALSELGQKQAEALGQYLASKHIDCLVTSDLTRAWQTAQSIVKGRPPLRLHTSELLQERNFGDYRGQSYDAINVDVTSLREAPPGGESMQAFEERVARAFEYLIDLYQELKEELPERPDPLVVAVSHGLVIRGMIAKHVQLSADFSPPDHLANTSVTVFEGTAPFRLTVANSSIHLADGIHHKLASAFGG